MSARRKGRTTDKGDRGRLAEDFEEDRTHPVATDDEGLSAGVASMRPGGRVALMLLGAFALGALAAWIKGRGGAGPEAEIRTAIGNLSTPWILVGFVAGIVFTRPRSGALAGLVATMVVLTGFYLVSSLLHDAGQGIVGDLRLELSANRGYLQGGVITGLAFGALGTWWRQRRTLRASFLAGALLMAEPVVLILLSALGPGGALDPDGVTPTLVRIVPGWGLSGDSSTVAITVYATEFALGLAVLVAALRPRRPHAVGR